MRGNGIRVNMGDELGCMGVKKINLLICWFKYGLVQYQGNYMYAAQFCKIIGEEEVWNQKPLFDIQDSPNSCLNSCSIKWHWILLGNSIS